MAVELGTQGETADQLWEQYRNLIVNPDVIGTDVHIEFQKREVAEAYSLRMAQSVSVGRGGLTPELAMFAADIVDTNLTAQEEIIKNSSDSHAQHRAEEITHNYTRAIIDLFPLVPHEQAERLFSHFRTDFIEAFLKNERIDDSWKIRAAEQFHTQISGNLEQFHRLQHLRFGSIYWHDTLYVKYERILGGAIASTGTPFVENEVRFMLGLTHDKLVVPTYNTVQAMTAIVDPGLKHRFVRRQLSAVDGMGKKEFTVNFVRDFSHEDRDLKDVEAILTEYPDNEEAPRLRAEIEAYRSGALAEKISKTERSNELAAVLEKMRTFTPPAEQSEEFISG